MADNKNPTAHRMEDNAPNLPIASLAVAGLVGAGIMALLASISTLVRQH